VALLLSLLGTSCRRATWSAVELEQFYAICGGGAKDADCRCLAQELPKLMSFAAYAELAAASKAVDPSKLNDETLRKAAHAAVVCAKR
jgi:hypothetical protein